MRETKKFLIAFMGPVGSGKSHIAKIFAKKLKGILIRTDDIRVSLREQKKPYTDALRIAARLRDQALGQNKSVIMDFDAVLPRRQKELTAIARRYGAHFFLIHIHTPETLILQRLRAKHYTKKELFRNAAEAIRVYHIRKKLHINPTLSKPCTIGTELSPYLHHIFPRYIKKPHGKGGIKQLRTRPNFVINNSESLTPQIQQIVKKIKKLNVKQGLTLSK